MLTFEQIKELIDIVCRKGLQALEVERSDFRIKIEGQKIVGEDGAPVQIVDAADLALNTADGSDAGVEAAAGVAEEAGHTITSPIVGTFYEAPSPDSDAYVQVGDTVSQGQVLCIVEAMKLMNEIESDVDGVVVEIYGRNAQPVEFGEPLFAIRPA